MILIKYAPYIAVSAIFCIGLYGIITNTNLVKKLLSLSILQSAVIILFISMGKVENGIPPILDYSNKPPLLHTTMRITERSYANPLPQVLMLTAIVVGLSTLSLGLALVVRIKEEYGTIDDNQIATINLHQDD